MSLPSANSDKSIVLCPTCEGKGYRECSELIDYHKRKYREWEESCVDCKSKGRVLKITNITYEPLKDVVLGSTKDPNQEEIHQLQLEFPIYKEGIISMKSRKIGKFYITEELLDNHDIVKAILAHMVVLRAEYRYDRASMEYYAISDLFEEVPKYEEAPTYDIIVNEQEKTVSARKLQ